MFIADMDNSSNLASHITDLSSTSFSNLLKPLIPSILETESLRKLVEIRYQQCIQWRKLSSDLLSNIFSYCTPKEIVSICRRVDHGWESASRKSEAWKSSRLQFCHIDDYPKPGTIQVASSIKGLQHVLFNNIMISETGKCSNVLPFIQALVTQNSHSLLSIKISIYQNCSVTSPSYIILNQCIAAIGQCKALKHLTLINFAQPFQGKYIALALSSSTCRLETLTFDCIFFSTDDLIQIIESYCVSTVRNLSLSYFDISEVIVSTIFKKLIHLTSLKLPLYQERPQNVMSTIDNISTQLEYLSAPLQNLIHEQGICRIFPKLNSLHIFLDGSLFDIKSFWMNLGPELQKIEIWSYHNISWFFQTISTTKYLTRCRLYLQKPLLFEDIQAISKIKPLEHLSLASSAVFQISATYLVEMGKKMINLQTLDLQRVLICDIEPVISGLGFPKLRNLIFDVSFGNHNETEKLKQACKARNIALRLSCVE